MTWVSRALASLLVVVAAFALALTLFALGGAFGFYPLVIGPQFTVGDMASITVAGGTLFLGGATALLTLSPRIAALRLAMRLKQVVLRTGHSWTSLSTKTCLQIGRPTSDSRG